METLLFVQRVVAALACAALFTACSGGSLQPLGGGGSAPPAATIPKSGALHDPSAIRPDRGKSWMLPSLASCVYDGKLPPCGMLYVSNYLDNDVLVFKNEKLIGKLTGFNGPDGLCSDKSGNVWIVNNLGASVVEYAHGGTSPIKTLSDAGVYPLGCAVNPITGSLVVTNIYTTGSGPGSVSIYHKDMGPPLVIGDSNIYYVFFCGFDASGNLYIDGLDTKQHFHFAELPRGKFEFKDITLDGTIYWPGAIAWDGTYVDVGDQEYQNSVASAIYQTTGAGGHIAGATLLSGAQDVVGYWLGAGSVIGPDANLNDVGLYRYPSGGEPTATLNKFDGPYGAVVSVAR
jgi:hypothetical protein